MVSHEYKCIFIHIPKCAGTSIENALGHFEGHLGRDRQDHRAIRMLERPLLNANIISSKENIKIGLRRMRYKLSTQKNPRNKFTVNKNSMSNILNLLLYGTLGRELTHGMKMLWTERYIGKTSILQVT